MADAPFEIPQQMRDLADQNIKQAHAAYEQLTAFVTKAMEAWMGAMPSPMACFDASDAVRSRPDEGVHHANAGAL